MRRRMGWALVGGAIAFAAQTGATVIAGHLTSDEPASPAILTGAIDESTIVLGDVISNTCSIAITLNPETADTVSMLPFVELPEVD